MVCHEEKKKPWSRLIILFGWEKDIVFVRVYNTRFTCLEHELYLSRLSEHLFEQDVKQHNYIANMTIIFFFFFTFFIKKKNCRPSIKLGFDNKYNIFSDNKYYRVQTEPYLIKHVNGLPKSCSNR
jgi:hypothetical protein